MHKLARCRSSEKGCVCVWLLIHLCLSRWAGNAVLALSSTLGTLMDLRFLPDQGVDLLALDVIQPVDGILDHLLVGLKVHDEDLHTQYACTPVMYCVLGCGGTDAELSPYSPQGSGAASLWAALWNC